MIKVDTARLPLLLRELRAGRPRGLAGSATAGNAYRAGTGLFELIAARYERRSLMVTANQPFGEWTSVFQDAAMTLAAVDRLVHHSTIFEMNVASYRR